MKLKRPKSVLTAIIVIFCFLSAYNNAQIYIPRIDFKNRISLAFVGDLMCHSTQFNYARVNADSFDFKPVFRYIKKELSGDLIVGNLETVIGGQKAKYTGYPKFNSPDDYLYALKDAGFNFLFTSNNHALDRGEKGILRTIRLLNGLGINHTGTFSSQKDRDSIRIINVKGINIAFLSYSFNENGNIIPVGKEYLVNVINNDLIKKDIDSATSKKPDLIICYFHFGEEYQRLPDKNQMELVDSTISYGADIIIASHPHVIQPFVFYKNTRSKLDSVFVAYSLGNFISNQRKRFTDAGMILKIILNKDFITGKISYEKVTYIPTWVFKGNTESGKEYFVLNSETAVSDSTLTFLLKSDLMKMEQSLEDTKVLLSKYKSVNSLEMLMKKKSHK